MGYRIALLLKEHYRVFLKEWRSRMAPDTELEFFSYDTSEELIQVFFRERSRFDGFYVSGIIPYRMLQIAEKDRESAVIGYSSIDIANTYRILLQKLVETEAKKLSRIGMDFLSGEENLEDMIMADGLGKAIHMYEERWESRKSVEEIDEEEIQVNRMYKEYCQRNAFDFIITYFYSVVENVRKYEVECCYVYPSTESFCQVIEDMKKSISLNAMKGKLNAAVYIEMEKNSDKQEKALREEKAKLYQSLSRFNKKYLNKMILKDNGTDMELFTDYALLKDMTGGFKHCPLGERLKADADFSGGIGYGIGDSIYQARINAMDASRYGRNMNQTGDSSVLIDENENITMLKTQESQETVKISESYINLIANEVKLSTETVLKIVKVMQVKKSNQITSQDLMEALQISLRTANKFLSILEKGGYAYISGQKRNGNKGRPVNVYRLNIKY